MLQQHNNESTNPLNAFPTHNINNSNSSNHSHHQKSNGHHEQQSNVNSNSSNNHASKNFNEDTDEVEEELEDLRRFERVNKKQETNNHNRVFDPEQLAAQHQLHHQNHNVQQAHVHNSNHIHEAAFATHSKPLNCKVNGKSTNNDVNGPSSEIFTKLYNLNKNGIEVRTGVENGEYDNVLSHNNDDSVDVSNLISQFRLATSNS